MCTQPTRRLAPKTLVLLSVLIGASVSTACRSYAAGNNRDVLDNEIRAVNAWVKHAFDKPQQRSIKSENSVVVVTRSTQAHKILANRSVWDTPLTLGGKEYGHGIYMDAPASIKISLVQPALEFTATVGIDQNRSTNMNDIGEASFHVYVEGKEIFSTSALKGSTGPKDIKVPLNGASQFTLEVAPGNDRSFDQCAWVDAAVKLKDGTVRFLDEFGFISSFPPRRLSVPFSFTYDGTPSDSFLDQWRYSVRTETVKDGNRNIISYKDPSTRLLIECTATTYDDNPAVDWVFHLRNMGSTDTPIIEQFMPIDVADFFDDDTPEPIALHWIKGGKASVDQYLPHKELLQEGQPRQFNPIDWSFNYLPYFNLESPDGGWIIAIGWTGKTMAEFFGFPSGGAAVKAGMANTHFRLRPGEKVRTPRIVALRWDGNEMIRGYNSFRRLMLNHYVQQRHGGPALPPVSYGSTAAIHINDYQLPTETNQLVAIDKAATLGAEAYWLDAYWMPTCWPNLKLGDWFPRPADFPNGLRPLSDAAHGNNMDFILWMVPQCAAVDTEMGRNETFTKYRASQGLLNLGVPEACDFLIDEVSGMIKEYGVDVYREDITAVPDEQGTADRQGITEMKYVEGLYNYWSGLLHSNPGLLIDNCGGGGTKVDLETMSRSYVLWRSDHQDIGEGLRGSKHWPYMAMTDQVIVTGLSLYFPLHTGSIWDMHPYTFRSAMSPGIVIYNDIMAEAFPDELAKQGIAELKELRPFFLGDIYPLMDLTVSQRDWYAYQLDRPDAGEGIAFFFRRPGSPFLMADVEMYNIDPDALYMVSITGETYTQSPWKEMTGKELIHPEVIIREKPGSALLRYRLVQSTQ